MTTPELELESAPLDMQDEVLPERPRIEKPEPVALASVTTALAVHGDGSFEHPVFGIGELNPDSAAHPFDGLCKVCSQAIPPRETRLDILWRNCDHKAADGRWLFRGHRAVNCCEECYRDAGKDGATLERQRTWWEEKCPIDFRDPWDNSKGDAKLFSRVMQFDPAKGRGLLIHGQTDSCKTRVVWRLLKRLAEEGHEWLFVEAIDLLDNIPERAFSIPILVIDDLGNDTLTAQKEVKLLKILRTRANWHRPVIITTQFTGDSLQKRFTETATAQAVIRRMRNFCDSVTARPLQSA